MKTRTLHRLRRALKKRSEPSTRATERAQVLAELDRASQHAKDMAARAVADLTPKEREILRAHSDRAVASNAGRFTRDLAATDPSSDIAAALAPKPTGGAMLHAMLTGKKA